MVKKVILSCFLTFIIIFTGNQDNIANAEAIYISNFSEKNWGHSFKGAELYLWSSGVRCNSYSVNASTVVQCGTRINFSNGETLAATFIFKRASTRDWIFTWFHTLVPNSRSNNYVYVNWDDAEGKLLNFVLSNYD